MENMEFILAAGDRTGWVVLAGLGALAGTLIMYLVFRKRVPGSPVGRLSLLRLLTMGLAVILFLAPVIRYQTVTPQRRRTIILIDRSGSMGVRDMHQTSRLEAVHGLLYEDNMAAQFADLGPMAIYAFDEKIRDYDAGKAGPARGNTHIAGVLNELLEQEGPEGINAVVLFSDGVETGQAKMPPAYRSIPIYAVGTGGAVSSDLTSPDLSIAVKGRLYRKLFVEEESGVSFTVEEKSGYTGEVKVSLHRGGFGLAAEKVFLRDGFAKGMLRFTPRRTGAVTYQLRVAPFDDETIRMNNRAIIYGDVYKKRIHVLYAEGSIKSEYKFLKRYLVANSAFEAVALLQTATGRFLHQGQDLETDLSLEEFPGEDLLAGMDVVIIGDIAMREKGFANLMAYIENGGGVIFAAPLKLAASGQGLQKVLPDREVAVVYTPPGGRSRLNITELGRHAGLFKASRAFLENAAVVKGVMKFANVPAGFRALISTAAERIPFLLTTRRGKGKVHVVCSDTTYLWFMAGGGDGKDAHAAFWGALIQDAAGSDIIEESQDKIEYRLRKRFFEPGESIEVTAFVPKAAAEQGIVMELKVKDRETRADFVKVVGGNREYRAACVLDEGGEYVLVAASGTDRREIPIIVKKSGDELRHLDLESSYLRMMADASGGFYVPFNQASAVLSKIRYEARKEARMVQVPLWDSWAFFAIILALLSVEWAMRKRYDLY